MRIPTRNSEKSVRPVSQDPLITQEKYEELKQKLDKMILNQRPKLIEEVQRLGQFGDFSENAEYQIAKGKLRGLNNKILQIDDQLKHCQIIEPKKNADKVQVGHFVTVEINNKQKTYQILGSAETNPSAGVISRNSPLGIALLGAKIGETVQVILNDKVVNYKIIAIDNNKN